MVEVLLIKINYTKNLTGVKFAKTESRSETFANNTTIIQQGTQEISSGMQKSVSLISTPSLGSPAALIRPISSPSVETPITKTPCLIT